MSLVTPVTYIESIIVTSFKQKNLKEEAGLEDDGQQDSLLRFRTQGVVFIGVRINKKELLFVFSLQIRVNYVKL